MNHLRRRSFLGAFMGLSTWGWIWLAAMLVPKFAAQLAQLGTIRLWGVLAIAFGMGFGAYFLLTQLTPRRAPRSSQMASIVEEAHLPLEGDEVR